MKLRNVTIGLALMLAPGVAQADWYEAKSRHFVIYSDDKPENLREFAGKLEKFDAGVRLIRDAEDPPIGDGLRLTVYVLDDVNAVSKLAVGGRSDIAGFYIPRASGSVAFVPRKAGGLRRSDLSAESVFFHEYAHHLMYQNLTGSPPRWVSEGFAEFFSIPEFIGNGIRLGTPAQHRSTTLYQLGKPKLAEMIGGTMDRRSSLENARLYGRGWLLTHYLTFEKSRSGQMGKYLTGIAQGKTPLEAGEAAFGDLRRLDSELDRYLRMNKFTHLDINSPVLAANVATIQLRRLRPGEAEIIETRMRSHRGVDDKTAPDVAADARRVAARYPNDPFVQRTLAEAELDAKNPAAALAAANRAIALDPTYVEAILHKGRAMMALAEGNPETADWNAIRALFAQANRLDKEDPEPLALFYESYSAQGIGATDNAFEGLLYAQLLAPQDASLRFMAAGGLVARNRLNEAHRMLEPLLMQAHGGEKARERVRQLLADLAAGRKEAVLTELNKPQEEDEDDED